MLEFLREVALATRPWSFTAAVIPVLLTVAVTESTMVSKDTLVALAMAVSIQAGANLTNTYFDFVNGIDTEGQGEETLVMRKLSPSVVLGTSFCCYVLGTILLYPYLVASYSSELPIVFASGLLLALFYTADPVGLKYHALGDVTVFLCFGPLLMQCVSLILTGATKQALFLYTIPIGCLTEAILHANNSRDIETDLRAGAATLAGLIGWEVSRHFYTVLLVGAYSSALYIAYTRHAGCLLVFLTIPMAARLVRKFARKELKDLEKETAQLHLPFGLLVVVGVVYSNLQG